MSDKLDHFTRLMRKMRDSSESLNTPLTPAGDDLNKIELFGVEQPMGIDSFNTLVGYMTKYLRLDMSGANKAHKAGKLRLNHLILTLADVMEIDTLREDEQEQRAQHAG